MATLTLTATAPMITATCKSMDMRAIAVRRGKITQCLAFVVRLSNSTVAETRRQQTALLGRLGKIAHRKLTLGFDARSVDEFDDLVANLENGMLPMARRTFSLLKPFPNVTRTELVDYPQPTGPATETDFHFKTVLLPAENPAAWAIREAGIDAEALDLNQLEDLNAWLEAGIVGMNVNGIILVPIYAKIDFPLRLVDGFVQTGFTCHRWLFDRVDKYGIRTNKWSGPPVERPKLEITMADQSGEMVTGFVRASFTLEPSSLEAAVRFEFRDKLLETVASAQIAASQLKTSEPDARRMFGNQNAVEGFPLLRVAPASDPVMLFDSLLLHPAIVEVARGLFKDRHYASAILEAFKRVNSEVKKASGLLDKDGKGLMGEAFRDDRPPVKLNPLQTRSDRDEQEGFRLIFMGAMTGIRNPKAHDAIRQTDPFKTLEYLALASLLLKRVDERIKYGAES